MNKVRIVKAIVRSYFVAALIGSFTHVVHAAHKVGLHGWEMWSTPFMIDGIAIIGLIMRGDQFSDDTRRWGLITQYGAGTMSLIANVYAAENAGGMIYGVGIVALFLFSEFLSTKITSAADIAAAEAAADAAAADAAKRADRNAKARTRRAARKTTPTTKTTRSTTNRPLKAV